jgi:CubicO group peptidase (beta-lactamase class C family)
VALSLANSTALAQDQRLEPALKIISEAVDRGDVPGASVLVMQDGKTLVSEAFGTADLEAGRAFRPNTIAWIASLTKPITAAAAMTLVDRGRLSLDDTVDKYLPEFANLQTPDGKPAAITIRQLMSHSSGIQSSVPLRPSFFFEQPWYRRSLAEVAAAIAKTKLLREPGSAVEYSNAAPYVLGRIVELQARQPFGDYVREQILEPLGMRDTAFAIPAAKIDRAATVYRRQDGQLVIYCRFDPAWEVRMTMPDGGLFSTPRDIAAFAQSFLAKKSPILSAKSVEAMLTRQSEGYGLAWILDRPGQFSHWGSSGTLVWADRGTKVVGVVFFQVQDRSRIEPIQSRFRDAVTAALAAEAK